MAAKWRSLAWKIAGANIALAVLTVLVVVTLEVRRDRQLLESNIRRELTQAVASGALLLGWISAFSIRSRTCSPPQGGRGLKPTAV